jgi:predicted nucleotidyltransferase component of viral defense system
METQMIFHETDLFEDAISAAAEHFGMRGAFVEKDYWVTYALKNLSCSQEAQTTVFKGGTSLSKVFASINRFSEDVDLAIISELGQPQSSIKRQLKAVETAASQGLALLDDPPSVKKGKNRFSCYEYPHRKDEYSITKPYIRLEISAFNNPVPHIDAQIDSYLGRYLLEAGYEKLARENGLKPFPLLVLSIERTCCEKLLSLIRFSYRGADELRQKVRHFHDLALLAGDHRIRAMLDAKDYSILHSAYSDDKNTATFSGGWTERPLSESPLFKDYNAIWNSIKSQYHAELSELSWADSIPSDREVREALFQLLEFIEGYRG